MSDAGLRIAHCSDIHLSGGAADPCRAGFARALAAIRARSPDLMLLAGDLFDTNTVPDETVLWAMDALAALPFPVAMIPGNHDCMVAGGVYRRFDFGAIANVVFLGDEPGSVVALPALDAVVWGRGMVDHAPTFRPLAGIPARPPGARWSLGLGHGIFVPRGEQTYRSSPIRMEEIEASGFDYLALGHHHAAMDLATPKICAAYSGSPTDTLGCGPSYAMVELAGPGAAVLRIEVVG
jgi:DNA repair exonuclease SbcCD nuclease subunit